MPTNNGDSSALAIQESTKKAVLELFGDPRKTERHIRLVQNYIEKDPNLRGCTRESIQQVAIDAAASGLDVGTFQRSAWIIPYVTNGRKEAQFRPSYVGLIKALKESGACMSVVAERWCKNDKMVGGWRTGEKPRHVVVDPNNRGPLIAVFAFARMVNGVVESEMMNLKEIEQVKKSAGDTPAYRFYPEQMMKKSVIRRLCNRLWGDVSDQTMKPEQAARLQALMEIEDRDFNFTNSQQNVDASGTSLDEIADELPAHEPPRKAPPPQAPPKVVVKPDPKPAPQEVVVEAAEAQVVEVEPAAPQYIDETQQAALERYILAGGIRVAEFSDAVRIATDGKADRLDQILTSDLDTVRGRIEQMVKDRRESAKKKGA